ncbi:MAG: F0F1 ATP synthase subunit A [Neisseriales bacterium]|nr:MAG: F0F1 ATP synthase subunit A [Neisseriales bacterium]
MAIELTPKSYIVHHLTNLTHTGHLQERVVDFHLLNIDSILWSIIAGLIILVSLYAIIKPATASTPNRWQAAVELLVEFVANQSRTIVRGKQSFVAPLALITFLWVVMMNSFDLLPVDLMPSVMEYLGVQHNHMRIVPTADLNTTLGMALGVFGMSLFFNLRHKHLSGFCKELVTVPFGANLFFWPFNLLLNLIEYIAKTLSLGMRLFGNMLAGELIFCLIALLGTLWTGLNFTSLLGVAGHFLAGIAWAIFHILIIVLQGFIFMMLTLVYIGQACDHHT